MTSTRAVPVAQAGYRGMKHPCAHHFTSQHDSPHSVQATVGEVRNVNLTVEGSAGECAQGTGENQ